MKIKLKPFLDEHLPLFEKWLCQERIDKWYEPTDDWVKEVKGERTSIIGLNTL